MKKMVLLLLGVFLLLAKPCLADEAELSIPASCYQGNTFISYTIRGGDTLYGISKNHGFDVQTLAAINDISNIREIEVGQTLRIPTFNEVDHQVVLGENLMAVAELYGVDEAQIASANDLWQQEALPVGLKLTIPGLTQAQAMAKQVSARGSYFRLVAPIQGIITSNYGYRGQEFHTGLDIASAYGSPVLSAEKGQVISAGWDGNYGYAVVIDHKNGYQTRYAHNSMLTVKAGDYVSQGQTIALVGSTGRSTGPHVHFEVLNNGRTANPKDFVVIGR